MLTYLKEETSDLSEHETIQSGEDLENIKVKYWHPGRE